NASSALSIVSSGVLADKDLNVRRNAFLEVSRMPSSKEVASELIRQRNQVEQDKWLNDSWLIALSKHNEGILDSLLSTLPPRNKANESEVEKEVNLFPSESFEQVKNSLPEGWHKQIYNGSASFAVDTKVKHSGKNSVRISSEKGSDAGLKIFKDLDAGTYKLSGWVKTDNVRNVSKTGACFNIEGNVTKAVTKDVKGTADWRLLELTFKVRKSGRIGFNCLFGGWGGAVGTAWFDDVKLIRVDGKASVSGFELVSKASAAYFKKNPKAVIEVAEKLMKVEENAAAAVLTNVSSVKDVKLTESELARLKVAAQDLSSKNRKYLVKFAAVNGYDLGLGSVEAEKAFVAEILKGNAAKGRANATTCIGCHGTDLNGDDGRKSPALAGQSEWYIITQMQKYKHELRGADVSDVNAIAMRDVSSKLSSQQMADVAAYIKENFKGKQHKITLGGNPEKGKQLYVACVACHGTEGQGNPQIQSPKLTGLQDWYIFDSLKKFKSKERGSAEGDVQGKLMQTSVMLLQDEQAMKDVAAYLSTLKP
ncbi:MAG: c-type cytochrome, partial [Lentisphaeraceae bacterium]|nr:c-type cytochrome [Lentisphaeraceae bacterium]